MKTVKPMDLHRADTIPDWEKIPVEEYSFLQKIAAATHGVVTPGNAMTAAGVALNISGNRDIQRGRVWPGIAKNLLSFVADKADGMLAEQTQTKSQIGAKLDVGADIFKHFHTIKTYHRAGLIETQTLRTFAGAKLANMAFTAIAMARGVEPQVGYLGKITAGAQATTMIAESIAKQLQTEGYHSLASTAETIAGASRVTANSFSVLTALSYGARMLSGAPSSEIARD